MTRPANLIFLLSDNHNASVMGNAGHPTVQTPTLDRLARMGTRFANSYCASPLCCPSRAAIATGRFPHQTGYWDNCLAYDGGVPSWGHRLRDMGGRAVSVGKLHFRSSDDDNGFDEEIAPMHIIGGIGALTHLLRYNGQQPPTPGQWDLYWQNSGIGETPYQAYDREITRLAIQWLTEVGQHLDRPWVLLVSYVSAHPPFTVPKRLLDRYPLEQVPLPICYQHDQRPMHPAIEHLRSASVYQAMDDTRRLQHIAACYFSLVTHLDEQLGEVLQAAETLQLLDRTRVLYTSDHGESYGHHGLFGKSHLMEPAARVPLILCGPSVPENTVIHTPVSSTDLYPTIVEGAGAKGGFGDEQISGQSLWPLLDGHTREGALFAEYHAAGSLNGSYLWRDGDLKLIYHVNMRPQLYDLAKDPLETYDRFEADAGRAIAQRLEADLRRFINPEAVDAQAKMAQRQLAEHHGGAEAIRDMDTVVYTPPPGHCPVIEPKRS